MAPLGEGQQPWDGPVWGSGSGDGALRTEPIEWEEEVQKGGKGKGDFGLLLLLAALVS